jgi:dipeptidyl aminopeptidase/acylaminoacyl peptidase
MRNATRLSLSLASALLASGAVAAPVLQGPPARPLTDPTSIVSPAKPDAHPAPIADLYSARSITDASWSPDGHWVVLGTNLSGRFNLWRAPAEGGFPEQLTVSDDRNSGAAITPAGQVIYQADLAGAEIYDLWMVPLAGGAPVNLTATPEVSETRPMVSPDGKLLAFERRSRAAPSTEIAILDLATRQVRALSHEQAPDRTWSLAGFSADSRTLYANRGDFQDRLSQVWSIDMASGAAKALTPEAEWVRADAVSPSGGVLAVTFEAGGVRQAGLLAIATGAVKPLKSDAWEQVAEDVSPDGHTIIFGSNVDGREDAFAFDVASGASRPLPLPPGYTLTASDSHESFSPDGSKLLVQHQSGEASPELWVVDLKAWKAWPITRLGLPSLSGLPRSQIVHYRSADGTVISAILWTPFNLRRDGHAPGVVLPHGGPTGQTMDTFNRLALAFASRGYVALAPNPRGSTGYGKAFEDANRKDLGGGDLEDEVAGAKFLADTGYVDARRIGVTGGSYGGYMTLMAVSKTRRCGRPAPNGSASSTGRTCTPPRRRPCSRTSAACWAIRRTTRRSTRPPAR